jgi:hypothetical protein
MIFDKIKNHAFRAASVQMNPEALLSLFVLSHRFIKKPNTLLLPLL